eukprot:TRINITY_DN605_c0_g2_i3.p3 TRINITY_DN605_c0_g2~~TRINITY_DN605_c0_g2_i3.p3  ORF type:complete len:208 (-),score=-12.69 TRINITY_DN605_c0_g2_i3:801-1424(-)
MNSLLCQNSFTSSSCALILIHMSSFSTPKTHRKLIVRKSCQGAVNQKRNPQFSKFTNPSHQPKLSDFGLTPPNDLQTTGTKSTPIRLHVSRYWRVFWRIMALEAKRNLNSFQQQMNNTIRSLKEKYCNQSNTEKLSIQNSLLCIKFLKFLIQYTQYIQHSTTYYTTWYNVNNKCVIKKFNLISICNNIKTQHVYCQNKINMTVYVNQ